jgi:subtilase family serine protease
MQHGILPSSAARQTQSTPEALPGGTPEALPGGTPEALPGGTPEALPGAHLACNQTFQQDQANCTLAINLNFPAIASLTTPANLLPGLHPADLQNRYNLPSAGPGATVAIVDAYDDPAAESDLAAYRSAFGLPACTSANGCFQKVNQEGSTASYPMPDQGWGAEISLDLDMVSAVCPNCKIVLVEANSPSFDDLGAAVDSAASMGANAITNSYYGPEWSGETAYDSHYHHQGVAITASAGDQASPFYPAASPYVTSVGGTSLSETAGAWSESAWQYTGQGCSTYESRPNWQNGWTGCKTRATVDVAAVADPQTGVTMYDSSYGGWLVAGGTSIGAPIVAAAYALSENPQGPAYSYGHRSGFYDIPPSGYDTATGLGSPRGVSGF